MSNRTTINVDKDSHTEAGDVKDEHDETWPEVLQFYAEYRPQVDTLNDPVDVDDLRAVTATPEDLTALRSDVLERLDELAENGDIEDRDFEDWFEPDYAQTIAEYIRMDLEVGQQSGPVELDATEYTKIADEIVGRLR